MTDDHNHLDYEAKTNVICFDCNKPKEACALCGKDLHKCTARTKLPKGYRVVEEFPDYMVNKQATVRHIATQRYCMLVRVSADNRALINVRKDGKPFTRSAQELRDKAFEDG